MSLLMYVSFAQPTWDMGMIGYEHPTTTLHHHMGMEIMRHQQHAAYIDKFGRGGRRQCPTRLQQLSNHHFINNTMTIPASDEHYNDTSEGNQEFLDPINGETTHALEDDPVMSRFQQFLSQEGRYQSGCHATRCSISPVEPFVNIFHRTLNMVDCSQTMLPLLAP